MADTAGPQNSTAAMDPFSNHAVTPEFNAAWPLLAQSTWIAGGSENPERIVYIFSDPNCPYCIALWQDAQAFLGRGLQVRHILVDILGPRSMAKAGWILASEEPLSALHGHYQYAAAKASAKVPARVLQQIEANTDLLLKLGSSITPTLFYKDDEGVVRRIIGRPDTATLAEIVFRTPRHKTE